MLDKFPSILPAVELQLFIKRQSVRFSFFSYPSIVHRLNKNIFDQNVFKLQWFKEYLFCRLDRNLESKEDLRQNISKVAA